MKSVRLIVCLAGVVLLGCSSEAPTAKTERPTAPTSEARNAAAAAKKSQAAAEPFGLRLQSEPFGETKEGIPITRYLLSNDAGMTVAIINYGAHVISIDVPDREKKSANITLGFPALAGYLGKQPFFGPICGRYANRIAKGKFKLDGKEYQLALNDGRNHIHGGIKSFSHVVWHATPAATPADGKSVGLEMMYESRDGEEGYPGQVKTTVVYTLTSSNEFRIDYRAVALKPTIINLTSHIYWNLHGAGTRDISDHLLTLQADKTLAVDDGLIPTGEMKPVKGTAMDFTAPARMGARLDEVDGSEGLRGYDHCYVLKPRSDPLKEVAAHIEDPETGRVLDIFTTEPGIQFYTANHLTGKPEDGGFKQHTGFCLECQHFPDSPNHPSFPSTVLEPNKPYTQTTIHRFSVK